MDESFDVIVCGSGAAGILAAVRLSDLGLKPLVIEKTSRYGGTSATSGGGIWIPNNGLSSEPDSKEQALRYLNYVSAGDYRPDKLEAYVEAAPQVLQYLQSLGLDFVSLPGFPDYYASAPGASTGRSLFPLEMDGAALGDHFFYMRELPSIFKLFDRYALDLEQSIALSARRPGWRWAAAKLILKYWTDVAWRRKTPIDRRLTQGRALIGGLRKAMLDRNIVLRLNTGVTRLLETQGRVCGVEVSSNTSVKQIKARQAVILATGGFEQDDGLRDMYLPVPTNSSWSLTPRTANTGDGLTAGMNIGADTESMACAWWAPSMQIPSRSIPNVDEVQPVFFDYYHPHSLCVNRQGVRFVNESCSYDQFGQAMISDQQKTGANVPCWLIFDRTFRSKYACGPILPSFVMPDDQLPPDWWQGYLVRAQCVGTLADKVGIDREVLSGTINRFNGYAETGKDTEFARGEGGFDRYFGDPDCTPNPSLGRVETPPFYAVKIDLGDLGTKGGLKTDSKARVLDTRGAHIEGLYAIGNSAGSPFGDCYPGGGGTLGPATIFAYIAAHDIAHRAEKNV